MKKELYRIFSKNQRMTSLICGCAGGCISAIIGNILLRFPKIGVFIYLDEDFYLYLWGITSLAVIKISYIFSLKIDLFLTCSFTLLTQSLILLVISNNTLSEIFYRYVILFFTFSAGYTLIKFIFAGKR